MFYNDKNRYPIKFIVRNGKVRNDGTVLIYLQYCLTADKRIILSTGIGIPIQYWNKKTSRLSKDLPAIYGNTTELEWTLTEQLRKVENMVEHFLKKGNVCPMQFLKENFK